MQQGTEVARQCDVTKMYRVEASSEK
jgi:hypothetical protein